MSLNVGSNKNIKKNYLFNLIYQVFVIITPLVTTPYISRVLGSSGIGKYSFCYSLVSYFVIFASLGFNTYAQREIASIQGDCKKQSEIFWEIIFARFGSVVLSFICFFALIYLCKLDYTYTVLMKILSINILATAFDVTFFFQGNEVFGIIVLRNIVIKCIGIVLIFIFVNGREDVWVYTLCQTVVLVVSNLSLWTRIPRVTEKVNLRELDFKRHYIPTLKLFIPTIAASVYTILDKTLIGILIPGTIVNAQGIVEKVSDLENGYYEQAEKIVKMALTVVTSLGTVMIPRNSNAISSGNMNEFKKNIQGAFVFVFFIGAPMTFGLSAISFNLCPWFFGAGFDKVPYLIILFSPLILIIGLSNVLGLQYLIPMRMDFQCATAISFGAIINLILNMLLIRKYLSYGACLASVGAELFVTCLMFYFARNQISFLDILRRAWKYIIYSIIMFIIIYCTQQFLYPSILNTLILIMEGIIVYVLELVITKDKLIVSYLEKILKKKEKTKMKIVSFIPIKLNNQRLPGKNTMLLNGRPTCDYIFETISNVDTIDEKYVYCSDEAIKPYIAPYEDKGLRFLKRDTYLDGFQVKGLEIIDRFVKDVDADIYVLTHVTQPFTKSESIAKALEKVVSGEYDSAFSAVVLQDYMWMNGKPFNYDMKNIVRTQDLDPIYMETGAFFIFRKEVFAELGQRIGNKPYIYEIDQFEAVDIDTAEDFEFAKAVAAYLANQ